jgi:sulfite reductase (ferredoxin)
LERRCCGGRISAQQMRAAADAADRFAAGELRTTNMQKPAGGERAQPQCAPALAGEFDAIGLPVGGSPFWRGVVACSGSEFCKIRDYSRPRVFSRWLVEELEEQAAWLRAAT